MVLTGKKLFLVLVFLLVYFCIRVPYFNMGWDGLDANGTDTNIFQNHPQKPNYLLIARMNGEDIYASAAGHPAPMYAMFSYMGYFFQKFENYSDLSNVQIIFRMKVISATFQLLIFILLLLIVFKNEKDGISKKTFSLYLGILLVSITPIAINNSNEFQVDSLFGLAMVGLYGIVLAAGLFKNISGRLFYALLFLAAAFVGLGKNEWSLLMFASLLASVVYLLVKKYSLKQSDNIADSYKIVGISFLGCLGGNILSYLFEPTLYMSGWDLLFRISKQASIFSKGGIIKLFFVTRARFVFIAPLLAMVAYTTFFIIKNIKKMDFIVLLSYFMSAAFFFSFFFSTWGPQPRYFAPAFAALLITTSIVYTKYQGPIGLKTTILYGLAALLVACLSINYIFDTRIKERHAYGIRDISSFIADPNCVPLLPVEDVYNKKNIDFVHRSVGMDAAKEIAKKYGRTMCQ